MNIRSSVKQPVCHPPTAPNSGSEKGQNQVQAPHGKGLFPMESVHITHDVAMIGMSLPGMSHGGGHGHSRDFIGGEICRGDAGNTGHSGHTGHTGHTQSHSEHFSAAGAVNAGLTLLSAYAAAGATYHGVKMLDHGHYAHGANHLLMGAGSGTMALAMATGNHSLHQASSVLMGAHGAVEVGLGVQSFLKAQTTKGKAMALTTAVHGACLAAAQFTSNAAISIPLYLGMGAATAVQSALAHS